MLTLVANEEICQKREKYHSENQLCYNERDKGFGLRNSSVRIASVTCWLQTLDLYFNPSKLLGFFVFVFFYL